MECESALGGESPAAMAHVAGCPRCRSALAWSRRGAAGAISASPPHPDLARFKARDARRRTYRALAVAAVLVAAAIGFHQPARPPIDVNAGLLDTLEDDGVALVATDPLRRSMLDGAFVVDPLADLDDPTDLFLPEGSL